MGRLRPGGPRKQLARNKRVLEALTKVTPVRTRKRQKCSKVSGTNVGGKAF